MPTFDGVCSSEFLVFPKRDHLDNRFLLAYLSQAEVVEFANHNMAGVQLPRVSFDKLAELDFPLPPVPEQRRIVAKLDALLARVRAARDQLDRVPSILKRFRQSVLAAACSQGDEVELGDVLESVRYGTAVKCSPERTGAPVLRIPNVVSGSISHDDMKYGLLSAKEKAALQLEPGDILMIRSNGSVGLVGRTAIVTEREEGFAYAGYLMRLRLKAGRALPEYANLALQTYDARVQIELPARSTSGVHNINSEEVRGLRIFLPKLPEQHEIVRRVEALFKRADAIEARVAAAAARADRLTQSILSRAFRGELVPQDPTDEPASALLARIREARG